MTCDKCGSNFGHVEGCEKALDHLKVQAVLQGSRNMAKTIEQRLRDAGFGHRPTTFSMNTGRHEVYRLDTGEIVGNYSAIESLELLRKHPHMRGWQSITRL